MPEAVNAPELHASSLRSFRAYQIEPGADPALSPQIGALVDMLTYTRLTTIQAVEGLSSEQLDLIPSGFKNSIGMLLAHIAAMHRRYQSLSFEGIDPITLPFFARHLGALTMGTDGERIQGHPLEWYRSELHHIQLVTLAGLAQRDDQWLASSLQVPDFSFPNHHWAWFYVMTDELNHRGQIRVLRHIVAPKVS